MKYQRSYANRIEPQLPDHQAYWLWLSFRALPATITVAIVLMVFTISPARSEDLTPNGVHGGQMLFRASEAGQFEPAIIQSGKVHFKISGMVATATLEQTFRNASDYWVEGIYAFPLPDQAAVRHMEMLVGDRRIVGNIKEKSIARKIYQAAKHEGKKASLVEQQRPNLFTNRVANIGPGEEVVVRLEYVQPLEYVAGEFSLRFPMTITPRYMPSGTGSKYPPRFPLEHENEVAALSIDRYLGWALPASSLASGDSLNGIEITASLDMGMPLARITANYHQIVLSRNKGVYDISLAGGPSEMDRDFVLHWQPVTGSAPSAAVFTERVGDDVFGLLMLVPPDPALSTEKDILPREMIFVIDTSGSMGGVSIEQARQSLAAALRKLRPGDSFNIIEFNSNYRTLFREPVPASQHALQKASEFVRLLSAGGGTEMLPALKAALAAPRQQTEEALAGKVRQVIFITDGAIGNESQLFEEIEKTLGDNRLFTVGIGSAPNSWFMRKAAQFGRGSHTHIGAPEEVSAKMQALFEQISTPLTQDIQVAWPGAVEAYPQRVPDLFAGQPVVVAFKYSHNLAPADIEVSGQMANRSWSRRLMLSDDNDSSPGSSQSRGIASLWAREKIASLLDQKLMGRDADAVRADVLAVALTHSLMSPYTSFVAVEERVTRPRGDGVSSVAIPNTQPHGQSPQGFAYPVTATTGPANIFLGGFMLFLMLITHVMRQPEVDREPADDD